MFEEESDGETGALAMYAFFCFPHGDSLILNYRGEFADLLGEDYLGLRELGIADEFGLSALSVPKKLLRGRKGQNKPTAAKPTEPPPPFPPPPQFVPFTASMVADQIGLLQPYYQNRFVALSASTEPAPLPPLPGPLLPNASWSHPSASSLPTPAMLPTNGTSSLLPSLPNIRPDLVLPDDIPSPAQLKISPIGQIAKSGAAASAARKKSTAAKTIIDGNVTGSLGTVGTPPTTTGPDGGAAKKKKATTGVGNGRKKKPDASGSAPPPVFGGQGGPILPAVVIASA